MTQETKVGIFVISCILGIILLSALLGNIHLFGKGDINVKFEVSNAGGLAPKSKIKYKGIVVGQVKKVYLQQGRVVVDAAIKYDYLIPDNITVLLAQDGIMGDKFLDLVIRSKTPSVGYLREGGVYSSHTEPLTMEDLSTKIVEMAENISLLTGALHSDFLSTENKENFSAMLKNLQHTTRTLDMIVTENKNSIDQILKGVNDFSNVLSELSTDDNVKNLQDIIDNVKTVTKDAKLTLAQLNKLTESISHGDGTIGMLINDNETRDQIKKAVDGVTSMVAKADSMVLQIESGADYIARHEKARGYFDLKIIPNDDKYYMFGISNKPLGSHYLKETTYKVVDPLNPANNKTYTEYEDKFEDKKLVFSLQYALLFDKMFGVRGGMFENQLGFGLDYYPLKNDNLTLTVEASDFFRKKYGIYYKANVKYRFLNHFFVQAGWDDFGSSERNSFSVGAGIYFIDNDLKYLVGSVPLPSGN